MGKILIIDDDESLCDLLQRQVAFMGHTANTAQRLKQGLAILETEDCDVVLLDVRLPDGNGLEAIPKVRGSRCAPEVIIITGQGDPDGAELAVRGGAWAYLEKPCPMKDTRLLLTRALQFREEKATQPPVRALDLGGIVFQSTVMKNCLDLLAQGAAGDMSVLVSGETGTGKELFCRAIHNNSRRAPGPLIIVDCAALPDTLAESTLFGHEKGAYTGADRERSGLVREAHGGTLFLDEIGELPMSLQKVLLRVLQERRYRPVGGREEVSSDFRLVAATNRDLEAMAGRGLFRSDLLFRVRALEVRLPPLRERRDDIQALTMHHLARVCSAHGVAIKGLSPDYLEALELYNWPGNIRELINTVESSVTAAKEEATLFAWHLPVNIRVDLARKSVQGGGTTELPSEAPEKFPTFKEYRKASQRTADREYLRQLKLLSSGDIGLACQLSDLSRSRLYELLKEHGASAGWD